MRYKNHKLDLGLITIAIAFIGTYTWGYATEPTSKGSITELCKEKLNKSNDKAQSSSYNEDLLYYPDQNSLEDQYGKHDFDETQYASDHWDEYLEDPENIDDFPENIFDAQHD